MSLKQPMAAILNLVQLLLQAVGLALVMLGALLEMAVLVEALEM
jgi:hypothetical protein